MRLPHWLLVTLSGMIYLACGLFLLNLGGGLVMQGVEAMEQGNPQGHSLLALLGGWLGDARTGAMALFAVALLLGMMKGRMVMIKAARRTIDRILTLPNPASPLRIYSKGYLFLLLGMAGLGVAMRLLHVPTEMRGTILVAVGAALLQGGVFTLRSASQVRRLARG